MGPSYPSGRILSNVASDKPQVPLATHSMEGSGGRVVVVGGVEGGGREGKKTADWQKVVPI